MGKLEASFWCGDPIRGASLGRSNKNEPLGKVRLEKIRLDSGGYDNGGAYWGHGEPIYHAHGEDFEHFLRAIDRKDAKEQLLKIFPDIKFFR